MENQMFCFQCQETAKGTGCTIGGVCGKSPQVANALDLLLFTARGVSIVSTLLRDNGSYVCGDVNRFITDALFTSITNTSFDERSIMQKVQRGMALRNLMMITASQQEFELPDVDELQWNGCQHEYVEKSRTVGVHRHQDEDICSLHELITYGLKGMAAYMEHARNLGFEEEALDEYVQRTLSELASRPMSIDDLMGKVLETGERGVEAMALLDKANTSTYGEPRATRVNISAGHRPGILVSGHDLRDLEMLLEQSIRSGIDIYTHGEMLPAHYYPLLRQYPHLHGNYGSSWWHQREDFANFNGPILITSNCIVPVQETSSYRCRLYTTNSVNFPGCPYIEANNEGFKDFSRLIEHAQRCEPPKQTDYGNIIGGYAHGQVVQLADKIVEAVHRGKIRKFVVMAGCDGRQRSRTYYTDFALGLPNDCVILTAGCAKYRYNRLRLGSIDGIPRVLDAGQCNDSYSIIRTAVHLRDILGLKDVNELPIIYNIAWYEQKAVIVLLSLLALGIKDIHIGPTLPAFISPKILKILQEKFGLSGEQILVEDLVERTIEEDDECGSCRYKKDPFSL